MEPSRIQRFALMLLRPKIAVPLAILGILLSAPLIFRVSRLSGLPDIPPPFDVEKYGTVQITPEDNAYEHYTKASALLIGTTGLNDGEYDKALEEGWSGASEGVRKWVEDNRPALELWRKGTAAPDALFCQPKDQRFDTLSDELNDFREFARLAMLEGSRLEGEGKPEAAWKMYRAMFRSSRHCGRNGVIIERLVGIGTLVIAAESIEKWAANPDVDAAMLRQALSEISEDYEMTSPTSTGFQGEYFMILNYLDDPNLPSIFMNEWGSWGVGGNPIVAELPVGLTFFLFNEPELSRRVINHVFANWLAQVDNPRHARTPQHAGHLELYDPEPGAKTGSLNPMKLEESVRNSLVARLMLPALLQFEAVVSREQARQACLTVILAAQAYQRAHGEFPETMKPLQDGYLDVLPADPFGAAGETIHYRRDGDRAVVWSIDENQADDLGDVKYVSGSGEPGDIGYEFAVPGAAEVKP